MTMGLRSACMSPRKFKSDISTNTHGGLGFWKFENILDLIKVLNRHYNLNYIMDNAMVKGNKSPAMNLSEKQVSTSGEQSKKKEKSDTVILKDGKTV